MVDIQNLAIIIGIVIFAAIAVYIWDRRTKQESVDWSTALKLGTGAGAVAGGVVYAVGGEDMAETVVETAANITQDMFVGKAAF